MGMNLRGKFTNYYAAILLLLIPCPFSTCREGGSANHCNVTFPLSIHREAHQALPFGRGGRGEYYQGAVQ